jgi:exopolysaccharide biosynthesis polyprenyl glycosylphosphotransferase
MECGLEMSNSRQVFRTRLWQLRIGERRTLLVVGDFIVALISLAMSLTYWASSEKFAGLSTEFFQKRVPLWFFILPFAWLLLMSELYDLHRASDLQRTINGIFAGAVVGLVVYLALYFYYVNPPYSLLPRRGVASFLVTVSILTLLWRWLYIKVFTAPQFLRRVLLVGGGNTGLVFLRMVNKLKSRPFILVGIIDDDHRKLGTFIEDYQVIGTSDQLTRLVEDNQVTDLIVAISGDLRGEMFQALLDVQGTGVEIVRMPTAYEELLNRVPVMCLEADWILRSFLDDARGSNFYEVGKRLIDIVGALVGLFGMLLVLPFVALATFLDDGLPIFYGQIRSGRGGQPYTIIKFRTMRRDAEADGKAKWAKEDDERATRVGRFLRKSHLDELPQFINVLRGEMSLVGPRAERPELIRMFEEHVPFYRARLLVKPGISGWAQINFGYASSIEETVIKLEYDLYYIKHRSLLLDFMILMRTPGNMLGFRGR